MAQDFKSVAILTKNTLGVKKSCGQELEKGLDEKEVKSKMGGQGLCSATTDQNKILIITSQAAKHYVLNLLMFCGLICDY